MGVKLESKYLKGKIKHTFGECEVYHAKGEVYNKLFKLVADNSEQVNLESGLSDIKVNNLNVVIRQLLIHCTNVENEEFWSNKTDEEMLEILDNGNGDFKEVVDALKDITIEIGNDVRKENIRQLQVTRNWVVGMTKEIMLSQDIDKSLKKFGLDMDKLSKIEQGDKEVIEEFQKSLLEKKKRINKKK